MELDEWEFLPNDEFFDLRDDGNGANSKGVSPCSNPKTVVDMNYFQKFIDPQQQKNSNNKRVVPVVPLQIDEIPTDEKEIKEDQSHKEQIKAQKQLGVPDFCDQDTKSQVFFKKLKENEFVDMKMDSPKSQNRGILPQSEMGTCDFEEKEMIVNDGDNKDSNLKKKEVDWEDNNGGLNIWKWAMTGIGAVVSLGVAAATVSIIVLGNRHKEERLSKSPKLHFQIYSHEKRINQVVHHAKKLNEAITAVRGAPLTRAHITYGGYYDGL